VFGVVAVISACTAMAASTTLDKIRECKEIALGYRDSSLPFSYLDAGMKPVGFSIDLCANIVEHLKKTLGLPQLSVKYIVVNSSNRISSVKSGFIDMECGSTANNLQRQKEVAFSVTTFVSQPKWMIKKSSEINGASGLKGKAVVVTQGSNAVSFAKETNEKEHLDLKIMQAKDHDESMSMLSFNRVVAFMEDDILLAGKKAFSRTPDAYKFLPESYEISYYGLMLPKDDTEFKAIVDQTLSEMMSSGAFEKVYYKWFQNPIPPLGTNLNFPLNPELRARMKNPSDKVFR
jgi:glutamate/aspartate transport system substrate-binding protein